VAGQQRDHDVGQQRRVVRRSRRHAHVHPGRRPPGGQVRPRPQLRL
jgi:hypothetical protein